MKAFREIFLPILLIVSATGYAAQGSGETKVPLVFSGGHETDPRDHRRPVILIASALGVPPEVFREAFSHVHPAPAGQEPSQEQVQGNKEALLGALSKYGVTNERLDEVSDYYRYPPGPNQMWKCTPASGYALVYGSSVSRVVVTNGGAGYSSAPIVTVQGISKQGKAELTFSKEFDKNGSVSSVKF